MKNPENFLRKSPWDSAILGVDSFEIIDLSPEVLDWVKNNPGHYTLKIDPLSSKKLLDDYGFYYCDTLLEPYCSQDRFVFFRHADISISREVKLKDVLAICHGAFAHGRFHRDFHINNELADIRYDNWVKQIYQSGDVYGLFYARELVGFIGLIKNKLALHAISKGFQGKGLAKFFWSAVCREFFTKGYKELTSSVSATNIPVINLYSSLGFRFRNPIDIYHKLVL